MAVHNSDLPPDDYARRDSKSQVLSWAPVFAPVVAVGVVVLVLNCTWCQKRKVQSEERRMRNRPVGYEEVEVGRPDLMDGEADVYHEFNTDIDGYQLPPHIRRQRRSEQNDKEHVAVVKVGTLTRVSLGNEQELKASSLQKDDT